MDSVKEQASAGFHLLAPEKEDVSHVLCAWNKIEKDPKINKNKHAEARVELTGTVCLARGRF